MLVIQNRDRSIREHRPILQSRCIGPIVGRFLSDKHTKDPTRWPVKLTTEPEF